VGLQHQFPEPEKGTSMPEEALEKSRAAAKEFRWFPSVPPPLMPYLASQNEYGNTVARPGPLICSYPLEPLVQGLKYRASDIGLRYSFQQTLNFVGLTDVMQGEDSLAFYTLQFKGKWAVYSSAGGDNSGWITTQIGAKTGLDHHSNTQDARSNLGTVTDPTGIWSSVNGIRIPELAWQQSLCGGRVVAVAGMISQRNYFDANAYAQSGRSEFMNSALIHSMVLTLPHYNFGLNIQYQPVKEWYAMVGSSAGNNSAGHAPWEDFNFDKWSLLGELGYAPHDFLGLGTGVYRVQPFMGQADSPTEGGLCFNLQQQLGRHSAFGWFGRFGFGGEEISSSADEQIGTGFVMHAPLKHLGLVPRLSNDLMGLGFIWSQPGATDKQIYHENEYVIETFYALQFSPTVKLMPDFQYIANPAFSSHDHATAAQIQLVLNW
jgi:carbohydrate-selective porin OprB